MDVDVLGTSFNIMAYKDEAAVKTTLLSGAVKVSRGAASSILRPGEQAQMGASGLKVAANVNTDAVVAWKNGFFNFDNADIQAIMRQVARWYNVRVEYQGIIPPVEMTGKIPRTISLKKVLEALELNSSLHFKLDNGMVTVTP